MGEVIKDGIEGLCVSIIIFIIFPDIFKNPAISCIGRWVNWSAVDCTQEMWGGDAVDYKRNTQYYICIIRRFIKTHLRIYFRKCIENVKKNKAHPAFEQASPLLFS